MLLGDTVVASSNRDLSLLMRQDQKSRTNERWWCNSGEPQSRHHLFVERRAWALQIRGLWKGVGKACELRRQRLDGCGMNERCGSLGVFEGHQGRLCGHGKEAPGGGRGGAYVQNRREMRTGQALTRPYFFTSSRSLLSPYVLFPSVFFLDFYCSGSHGKKEIGLLRYR